MARKGKSKSAGFNPADNLGKWLKKGKKRGGGKKKMQNFPDMGVAKGSKKRKGRRGKRGKAVGRAAAATSLGMIPQSGEPKRGGGGTESPFGSVPSLPQKLVTYSTAPKRFFNNH